MKTKPVFQCLVLLLWIGMVAELTAQTEQDVNFIRDVQPILKRHCDRCHGDVNQESGLTLNRRESLLGASGEDGIVVPGNPKESMLFVRLTDEDAGDVMPLDGDPLPADQLETIRRWIQAGASIPSDWKPTGHWAYQTPASVDVPEDGKDWSDHPIDRFVARRLREVGLTHQPVAEPGVLARRVALSLTGLPATLEQVRSLEQDPSPENYERFVDELLASPTFGQHWARHWLDLARYADSNGFQADQLRDSWAYRDWVVDAFNRDMPFDQFTVQQLAGDLLPDADDRTRIATGFHRTTICNVEAGVHPEANRVNQVFDRVNTTATVFLGTTLECAQCHDHKYDPFSQEDYYRLFAYFNNTPVEVEQKAGVRFDFYGPTMSLPMTESQRGLVQRYRQQLAKLKSEQQAVLAEQQFEQWMVTSREALKQGRPRWVTLPFQFQADGVESFQTLEDGSVLIEGDLPGSVVYRFEFDWSQSSDVLLGVRLDALRDDSLPGGGPGAGDAKRTNFVLHELEATWGEGDRKQSIDLGAPEASFSQQNYNVSGAIDGDRKTGWAISPQFQKPHWATFRVLAPQPVPEPTKLLVSLDQHFGRGRVIGRPKVSLLVGPAGTAELTDSMVELLQQDSLEPDELAELKQMFAESNPKLRKLDRQIKAVKQKLNAIEPPTTLVMVEKQPRKTYVMQRGDYLSPGNEVTAGTPDVLHPLDPNLPANRLGLAKWLVDDRNPLFARVAVNRFWGELFGQGIVTTPEDFGTQAEPPSHPEMLDWLALEFQRRRYSVKELLKTIVMSKTFRQQSVSNSARRELDPDNCWLSRGPRFRLPAESIRDNALAIAGLLTTEGGGEPIMPYQPAGIWRAVGRNQPKWTAESDQDRFRRGLYVVWKRAAPYPSFVTFDAPDRTSCTVKRPRTNTPLQALVLLNDRAYAEAAVGLAQRMIRESKSERPADIAGYGFRLATAQQAGQAATDVLVRVYQQERKLLQQKPELVEQRLGVLPDSFRDQEIDQTEVAAWYAVANVMLNLDQVITLH